MPPKGNRRRSRDSPMMNEPELSQEEIVEETSEGRAGKKRGNKCAPDDTICKLYRNSQMLTSTGLRKLLKSGGLTKDRYFFGALNDISAAIVGDIVDIAVGMTRANIRKTLSEAIMELACSAYIVDRCATDNKNSANAKKDRLITSARVWADQEKEKGRGEKQIAFSAEKIRTHIRLTYNNINIEKNAPTFLAAFMHNLVMDILLTLQSFDLKGNMKDPIVSFSRIFSASNRNQDTKGSENSNNVDFYVRLFKQKKFVIFAPQLFTSQEAAFKVRFLDPQVEKYVSTHRELLDRVFGVPEKGKNHNFRWSSESRDLLRFLSEELYKSELMDAVHTMQSCGKDKKKVMGRHAVRCPRVNEANLENYESIFKPGTLKNLTKLVLYRGSKEFPYRSTVEVRMAIDSYVKNILSQVVELLLDMVVSAKLKTVSGKLTKKCVETATGLRIAGSYIILTSTGAAGKHDLRFATSATSEETSKKAVKNASKTLLEKMKKQAKSPKRRASAKKAQAKRGRKASPKKTQTKSKINAASPRAAKKTPQRRGRPAKRSNSRSRSPRK